LGLDAEHRTLVSIFCSIFSFHSLEPSGHLRVFPPSKKLEAMMGRGILLWLLGVPIPVIILLWLFFGR
jgi:hypothetical protein